MSIFENQYKRIIAHRGKKNQKKKAIEELKELIVEIEADLNGNYKERNMITEIADVLNMCFQLIIIYSLDLQEIIKERMFKNERELARIEHEKEMEENAKRWSGEDL